MLWFWGQKVKGQGHILRVIEAVVTTGAVRRVKLQSIRHHQRTNTYR